MLPSVGTRLYHSRDINTAEIHKSLRQDSKAIENDYKYKLGGCRCFHLPLPTVEPLSQPFPPISVFSQHQCTSHQTDLLDLYRKLVQAEQDLRYVFQYIIDLLDTRISLSQQRYTLLSATVDRAW